MKLKLPLMLLASLLCCYIAPISARTVNYFNPQFESFAPDASQSSDYENFYVNTDGNSWHGTGSGKVEGFLRPQTPAPMKMSDLANISFKIGTTTPTQNALYLNFYSDTYWVEGGLKQKVTVRVKGSFPEHTLNTYSKNDFEFVVNNSAPMTFEEFQNSGLLDETWQLGYTSFSVGNETSINPGGVDVYNISFTLADGTTHIWNFGANENVWEINDSQDIGTQTFNKNIKLIGGEGNVGSSLVSIRRAGDAYSASMLGGNQSIGAGSEFTIKSFTSEALNITMSDVNIANVGAVQGVYLVEALINMNNAGTVAGSNLTINNLNASNSGVITSKGWSFFPLAGSILAVIGVETFELNNSTFTGNFATCNSPAEDVEGMGYIPGYTFAPQGNVYMNQVNSARFNQVLFSGNTVSAIGSGALGAAFCSFGSNVTIQDSSFIGNISTSLSSPVKGEDAMLASDGVIGAIYFASSAWGGDMASPLQAKLTNTTFERNKAVAWTENKGGGLARGGAIYSEARLKPIEANPSEGRGEKTSIVTTLTDCTFVGNESLSSSLDENSATMGGGGAIYLRGSELKLEVTKNDLVYSGNAASLDGINKDAMGGFLFLNVHTQTVNGNTQTFNAKATFDIAAGKTLSIGDGSAGYDSIAGNVGSLIVKDNAGKLIVNSSMEFYLGALEINAGTFATTSKVLGASSVKVASGVTFIAGVTGTNLVTSLASKTLSAEKGATLGTYLTNTGDLVTLKHSDIMNSIQSAYAQADVSYTYWTQGKFNIDFSTDDSGSIGGLGEGSTVTVTGSTDELTSGSINLAGGTADLTQVTGDQPISGSVVTGDTGTVVTKDSQTVLFDANQNVGYSLNGGNADTAGAKLIVGSETQSNASAPEVVLRGDINAKAMELNVGTTSVSGTVSTTEGIIVGNSNVNTNATLTNNGTIHGKVDVLAGNTLKGAGTYTGKVSLAQSTFVVGNSPGQSIFATGSSLNASDTTFLFAVDGTTAAVQGGSTSGTYSNIILRDTVSAMGTGNTATIEVWKGLFDATSTQLNLTLINNEGIGSIAPDFFTEGALVTGQYAELLKNAKISMDADGNVVLTGSLDTSYAQSVIAVDAQAYANSLWSSSQVLSDFGKLSRDQASAPRQKALNLWMSAMGDFSSVTGAQGYTYNGGGYGIGSDYAINKSWIAGAGFGQTWGTNKTDNAMLSNKQDGTMFSLYGQYTHSLKNKNTFFMDGYFGYAQVENKATAADGSSPAKWSDNAYAAGLRASWALEAGKDFIVTPFVALDFVTAAQGAIQAGTRTYSDGKMHNLTMPIGLNFAKKFSLGGSQYLIPSLSVAYAPDLSRKDPSVRSSVLGEEVKFTGVKPGRNAAIINVGTRWIITPAWSSSLNYTLEARPQMTNQAVNISCNYSF